MRVAVLRQGNFELDPRVQREVHALIDAGHEVDVIALRQRGQPYLERDGRLTVRRVPAPRQRGGAVAYLAEYGLFFLAAFALLTALHIRRRYKLVQVHTLPDPLVFAAIVPKLTGARVVLDLHECMPEFFATKFGTDLEQARLRNDGVDHQRQRRLHQLATVRPLAREEQVLDQLLRDRRGPPHTAAVLILGGGGDDLGEVDAAMMPEARIFGDDEGPDEEARHRVDGNEVGCSFAHVHDDAG